MSKKNLVRIPLVVALTMSTALSGCVTGQYNQAKFADGSIDECHIYRQPLIAATEKVGRNTLLTAAATGIAVGVVATLLGADPKTAIVAGLGGAAVGGFFGYQANQGTLSNESQKLLVELQGQAGAASRTPGTIARMTECRRNQLAQVKKSTDAGLLTPTLARKKLMEIRQQTQLDNQLVSEFVGEARKEVGNYVKLAAKNNISEEKLLGQYNDPNLPWLRRPEGARPSASASEAPLGTVSQKVSANVARVRANANTRSAVLGSVSRGDTVFVVSGEDRGDWKKIIYRGWPAYIYSPLLAQAASGSAASVPSPVAPPSQTSATVADVEGQNEQQVAVRNLSRATLEAESQQKELQAVDSEIDGLLNALNA